MARRRANELPAYVKQAHGRYYFLPGVRGKAAGWPSCIALGADEKAARHEALRLAPLLDLWAFGNRKVVDGKLRELLWRARYRSKEIGHACDIDMSTLRDLATKSRGMCAVTGIAFSLDRGSARSGPWTISLDRVDSRKGYVIGNVRLVCHAVNVAMNEWGEVVVLRVARAILRRNSERTAKTAIFRNGVNRVSA